MSERTELLSRQLVAAINTRDDELIQRFLDGRLAPVETELHREVRDCKMLRGIGEGVLRGSHPNGSAAVSAVLAAVDDDTLADPPAVAATPAAPATLLNLDEHIAAIEELGTREVALLVLLEHGGQLTSDAIRGRFLELGRKDTKSNLGSVLTRLKRPRAANGVPLTDHDTDAELWSLNNAGKEAAKRLAQKL